MASLHQLRILNLEDLAKRANHLAELVLTQGSDDETQAEARDLMSRFMAHEAMHGDLE